MATDGKKLSRGCTILALGYGGLLTASIAIVSRDADPSFAVGRHLWAGALANACLAVAEILVVLVFLRRGDRSAWWIAALPVPLYGIPILSLDSFFVSSERLVATLAPQIIGLLVVVIGLTLTAQHVFSKK